MVDCVTAFGLFNSGKGKLKMYHKDSHKLRGINLSIVRSILNTKTFKEEARKAFGIVSYDSDRIARTIVENMGIRSKKKVTNSYRMGYAILGRPLRPGKIRMNVFVKMHPAQVAETLLHEMIHSVFGYRHGYNFNKVLAGVAKEMWGIDININRSWSDVYEIDHILCKKLKTHFDHLPTAKGSFLWQEYVSILTANAAKAKSHDFVPKVAAKSIRSYNFKHGDKVQWKHKGVTYSGHIKRINKKRYTIIDTIGMRWLVPPRLVSLYTS
jgi:hypothetical protein